MASNIKPKVIQKELRVGVDALLDGFERFKKATAAGSKTDMVELFAGSTGQLVAGVFNREGGGNVAVMLDVGQEAPPVAGEAGTNVANEWGHDGGASLEWHAALFIVAAPAGSTDLAAALAALVQRPLPSRAIALGVGGIA